MDEERPAKTAKPARPGKRIKECPKCGILTRRLVLHDWRVHAGRPNYYYTRIDRKETS